MLISHERQADHKAYHASMDILGIALDFYMYSPSEELLINIQALEKSCEALKLRTQGDYTEADQRRKRVDDILNDKNI